MLHEPPFLAAALICSLLAALAACAAASYRRHTLPSRQPQPAKAPGGFSVLHLLLVALLAFLVGHFANVAVPLLSDKLGLGKQAHA